MSELVRLDEEECDSVLDVEGCTSEQRELHSPLSLSSPLSEGKGMEFERLGGEWRPDGGSESAGVDIVSSWTGTRQFDRQRSSQARQASR